MQTLQIFLPRSLRKQRGLGTRFSKIWRFVEIYFGKGAKNEENFLFLVCARKREVGKHTKDFSVYYILLAISEMETAGDMADISVLYSPRHCIFSCPGSSIPDLGQ